MKSGSPSGRWACKLLKTKGGGGGGVVSLKASMQSTSETSIKKRAKSATSLDALKDLGSFWLMVLGSFLEEVAGSLTENFAGNVGE